MPMVFPGVAVRIIRLAQRTTTTASITLRERLAVGQWQVWTLRVPLRAYVLAWPGAALAATSAAAAVTQWHAADIAVFIGLVVCGMIAIEATGSAAREPRGTIVRDLLTVWYLAIAIALPPVYALMAPILLGVYKLLRNQRMVVYRRVFSSAVLSLAYGCASVTFRAFPPSVAGARPGAGPHILTWTAAAVACGALAWTINNVPILGAIRLSDPEAQLRPLIVSRETATTDLVELSLAVTVGLLVAINPVLMVLVIPSIVLHRRHLLHEQLVSRTRLDAKTGLLNAATWEREAQAELSRAARTRTPLALAMLDIDHFKDVNDRYGHLAGDAVLARISAAMGALLREYDLIGRFGGEEFAIMLPHTTPDEARRIAERLRERLAEITTPVAIGTRSTNLHVTVSIGVATADSSRRDLSDLIAAADAALYYCKETGRNRVRLSSDSTTARPVAVPSCGSGGSAAGGPGTLVPQEPDGGCAGKGGPEPAGAMLPAGACQRNRTRDWPGGRADHHLPFG
jgi:diguanylate cyclase (GGDEF)-like protein